MGEAKGDREPSKAKRIIEAVEMTAIHLPIPEYLFSLRVDTALPSAKGFLP